MMPLPPVPSSGSYRPAGWAAIASGVFGIVAFGFLMAYFATAPAEVLESHDALGPGVAPPISRLLLTSNSVAVMLQYLLTIPVALALHAIGQQRSPRTSRAVVSVGIVALCGVALLEFLPLINPGVSDIFFMGPTGFVGAWLIAINWLFADALSRGLRVTGAIGGIGLVVIGASFFFLAPGLAVLAHHPFAYGNDADFHNGIALGGLLANLYPIWAILLGRRLVRAQGVLEREPHVTHHEVPAASASLDE